MSLSETTFPERLETPRLILRRPVAGDVEPIFARYETDPDVVRYLSWTPHAAPRRLSRVGRLRAGAIALGPQLANLKPV